MQVDILHCHGPRDHLLSVVAARLGSVKHVVRTKHNHNRLKSGFLSRFLYRKCSKIVTVSEHVRQVLIKDGIAPGAIETIYTGIDNHQFTPRPPVKTVARDLEITEDELVVGCVSSLHVRKGIQEILEAFKLLRESMPETKIRCLLVGKKWQRWSDVAAELGIEEDVIFTGFRRDVANLLSILDVYVLPSRDEALGTSILEAMAMGLPVVASNVGGIPEALRNEAGVIVSPKDPVGLAKAMKTLLEDHHRRTKLGENARERAKVDFSLETMVDRTADLYEQLMREL
jgi:glycosyltransferase involved in cell wall biosynthesis